MPAFSLALLLRALLVWLAFIIVESAQGVLRRILFRPEVALAVRQVSIVLAVCILIAITWFASRWMRLRSAAEALAVGGVWTVLTLAFEIGLGRATGASWTAIGADYDLRRGGLMVFGLLAMALTPWAVYAARARAGRVEHPPG